MNSSQLKELALQALQQAYSPYSKKRIGASVLLANGKAYAGCNIENASFGGTVCAERVAIWKAYSENSAQIKISEVYVASEADQPWPPCGLCRQVISEFGTATTKVIIFNKTGNTREFLFKDLFPESFGPTNF